MNLKSLSYNALIKYANNDISLPQSDQPATPTSTRQVGYQMNNNWRVAMRCKQHVGTQEWINCKHNACVHLREELHHLLECPRRIIGGCKERCNALKEELRKVREQTTKHPTIPDDYRRVPESNKLQMKLQLLNISEFVESSSYSPTSPAVDEPFQTLAKGDEEATVPVIELIPLDQVKMLSFIIEPYHIRATFWSYLFHAEHFCSFENAIRLFRVLSTGFRIG